MGSVVEKKTAWDFLQEEAYQEGCCDLVAGLAGDVAKTFPSDQVQSQFFHGTGPEKVFKFKPETRAIFGQ